MPLTYLSSMVSRQWHVYIKAMTFSAQLKQAACPWCGHVSAAGHLVQAHPRWTTAPTTSATGLNS